jgi:hypothetical protein
MILSKRPFIKTWQVCVLGNRSVHNIAVFHLTVVSAANGVVMVVCSTAWEDKRRKF